MKIEKITIQRRIASAINSAGQRLAWVADSLIPPDPRGRLPGAVLANAHTDLLARALRARDDLIGPFMSALMKLPEQPPEQPMAVLTEVLSPEEFDLLSHLIAGAYFLNEDVNRKLGYPGQLEMPYDPDYDEIAAVAQRIISRGAVYVDVKTKERADVKSLQAHRVAVGLE